MAARGPTIEAPAKAPAYDEDYAAWLQHQAMLLQNNRLDELDTENLADEVGDLGTSNWRGFVSAIRLVSLHMLKWDHQPALRTRSWQSTIAVQRDAIDDVLAESPSYRPRSETALVRAYRDARREASGETNLPLQTFPESCPYDWDAIMTREHRLPGDD